MAVNATYSGDPSNSDIDKVRFRCGDTGGSTFDERNEFFLSNSEVQFAINESGSVNQAALACAKRIKSKLAREADAEAGDGVVDFSQRMQHYEQIIKDLERETSLGNLKPFAGGIDKSDKESTKQDEDRAKPFFNREQFDSLRALDPDGSRNDEDYLDYFNA